MSQQHPVNAILEAWNRLEQPDATGTILPCNGSVAWAIGMVNARSFETLEDLFATSDRVWLGLTPSDWQQAFDSHPRIGEHKAKAATGQSLKWSAGEQSAAVIDATTEDKLAAANKEYEQKFGRIFIVCASGKATAALLAILTARLKNGAVTELSEAVEQQRQITQLRLRKWLDIK
ncbi:MAG TPA: 2-oxo-4-hydroxy-4-carboxy-5-ureidoimidazoline decarboxylase [Acidobacteriaceae bacterium]